VKSVSEKQSICSSKNVGRACSWKSVWFSLQTFKVPTIHGSEGQPTKFRALGVLDKYLGNI